MVETTRDQQDESLNYAVIKLIVSVPFSPADKQIALNEQFMVSTLHTLVPTKPRTSIQDSTLTAAVPSSAVFPAANPALPSSSPTPVTRNGRSQTLSLPPGQPQLMGQNREEEHSDEPKRRNRILMVLMRRLGSSKTFGENIIFMLNRAGSSQPPKLV